MKVWYVLKSMLFWLYFVLTLFLIGLKYLGYSIKWIVKNTVCLKSNHYK